jgi:hypothetical protein
VRAVVNDLDVVPVRIPHERRIVTVEVRHAKVDVIDELADVKFHRELLMAHSQPC